MDAIERRVSKLEEQIRISAFWFENAPEIPRTVQNPHDFESFRHLTIKNDVIGDGQTPYSGRQLIPSPA
jgi:hypothetical protein